MDKTYRLSITISGLCLVVVQARQRKAEAKSVNVLVPKAPKHTPRLVFKRNDFRSSEPANLELKRFFGPAGEDLLALPLGGKEAHFDVQTAQTKHRMEWAPKSRTDRPVSEKVMDWLIDAEDLELKPRNYDKIISRVRLPFGRLGAKNMIYDEAGEALLKWKYPKGPKKRRHAMADDITLEATVKEGDTRFQWGKGQWLDLAPRIRFNRLLEVCISNDDDAWNSLSTSSVKNPHEHLEFLAKAVGQPEDELDIPEEDDELRTGGRICTQVVYYDPRGV